MTIRVYPSIGPSEPIENHEWAGTFAGWLESKGVDWQAQNDQPIFVTINGEPLTVDCWATKTLSEGDDIAIRPLPNGGVFEGLASIIGKIFNTLFGWLMPGTGGGDYGAPEQGRKLEVATAKANQARLGEAVPELAGRFRRFPDYLTPPRRHFILPREQWLEFHACIGPGEYQILDEDVKVGDTPFSSLGDDGNYQIFGPGADLTVTNTHQHWHTVDEVGGTSSGTAGLELPVDPATVDNTDPPSYAIATNMLTRSAGDYPAGWGEGTIVNVEYPRLYTVATEGIPDPDPVEPDIDISRFDGYLGHIEPFIVGDEVSLGPLGSEITLRVENISVAGVRFEVFDEGSSSWVPYFISPGVGQSLIFGANLERAIQSFSPGSITVGGSPFQTGTVSNVRVVFAGGLVYGDWTSPFTGCPPSAETDLIEVDFFFPSGLAYISDEGETEPRELRVEVQYRNSVTKPAWTSAVYLFNEATLDQIGFTEQIPVPTMNPEVRVRRVGITSNDNQVYDTIHWFGYKTRLPTRTSYPRWSTMAIRLRSGGRLAAQSENQINVVATRILPALQPNGTWSVPEPTRDISAFFRYIAQSMGYTDADIDMDELLRLHLIWGARGDVFDHVFELTTVKEAMNVALGAGMAELTISDGLIKPVRDEPRTQWEQSYSPQNMTGPLQRSFRSRRHDDFDGVEVEYTDGATWSTRTVQCYLPGSQLLKLEKIKLKGVTDRTRAWRIGMRRIRTHRYRRWEYSFETEMDALNSEYLSYVPLLDDVPGYGQSALLTGIEQLSGGASVLRVSEALNWAPGQNHVIAFRRPDGSLAGPWPTEPGDDDYSAVAVLSGDLPVVTLKQELPHVYFGTLDEWSFPALITEIRPNGIELARVSAVNYSPEIYADDNNAPPL